MYRSDCNGSGSDPIHVLDCSLYLLRSIALFFVNCFVLKASNLFCHVVNVEFLLYVAYSNLFQTCLCQNFAFYIGFYVLYASTSVHKTCNLQNFAGFLGKYCTTVMTVMYYP